MKDKKRRRIKVEKNVNISEENKIKMSTYHFVALRRKSLLRLREIYYTRQRPH